MVGDEGEENIVRDHDVEEKAKDRELLLLKELGMLPLT